jgi:hypothetical protein
MKCAGCGQQTPGARFCAGCGARLGPACSACGTELPLDARFCPHCGQPSLTAAPADFASPATYTPKHLADRILEGLRSGVRDARLLAGLTGGPLIRGVFDAAPID